MQFVPFGSPEIEQRTGYARRHWSLRESAWLSIRSAGKTIPDGVLAMGSPAKVVRDLSQADIDRLQRTADNYMRRARLFKEQLRPQQL